jgi:hypothetical protein
VALAAVVVAALVVAAGACGAARLWGAMVACLLLGGGVHVGLWCVLRRRGSGEGFGRLVLVLGLATRLALAALGPAPTRDLTRYLWDGRLVASGISPYRSTPSAPEHAVARRLPAFSDIEHVDVPTIYPPLSQATFGALYLVGQGSPLAFRLGFALCDALTLLLLWRVLRKTDPGKLMLFALCPVAAFETAGAGHQDGLAALGIAALLTLRPAWGGAGWAASVLSKGHALLLLPRLVCVLGVRGLGVALGGMALLCVPFLLTGPPDLSGLRRFLDEWICYAPLWPTLRALGAPAWLASVLCLGLLLALSLGVALRPTAPARDARNVLGAALWCGKLVFPWYAVGFLPALTLAPSLPWLVWVSLLPLIYLPHLGLWPGSDRVLVPLLIYAPPLLLFLAAQRKRADQPV